MHIDVKNTIQRSDVVLEWNMHNIAGLHFEETLMERACGIGQHKARVRILQLKFADSRQNVLDALPFYVTCYHPDYQVRCGNIPFCFYVLKSLRGNVAIFLPVETMGDLHN